MAADEKLLSCNICSKNFKFLSTYKIHVGKHSKPRSESSIPHPEAFQNNIYDITAGSRHEVTNTADNIGITVKTETSAEFEMDHLEIKNKKTSKDAAVFACNICKKQYSTKHNLTRHEKMHLSGVRYVCDHCGLSYTTKYSLETHQLWHRNIKPWKCEICGAQFLQNGHYRRHLKIHADIKDEVCETCGRSFGDKDALRTHTLTHVDVSNFQCSICGVNLKLKSSLRNHMKIHEVEKKFTCEMCKRSFSQKKNYIAHIRLHKGHNVKRESYIQPITGFCNLCNKGFTNDGSLSKHMKKHKLGLLKNFNSTKLQKTSREHNHEDNTSIGRLKDEVSATGDYTNPNSMEKLKSILEAKTDEEMVSIIKYGFESVSQSCQANGSGDSQYYNHYNEQVPAHYSECNTANHYLQHQNRIHTNQIRHGVSNYHVNNQLVECLTKSWDRSLCGYNKDSVETYLSSSNEHRQGSKNVIQANISEKVNNSPCVSYCDKNSYRGEMKNVADDKINGSGIRNSESVYLENLGGIGENGDNQYSPKLVLSGTSNPGDDCERNNVNESTREISAKINTDKNNDSDATGEDKSSNECPKYLSNKNLEDLPKHDPRQNVEEFVRPVESSTFSEHSVSLHFEPQIKSNLEVVNHHETLECQDGHPQKHNLEVNIEGSMPLNSKKREQSDQSKTVIEKTTQEAAYRRFSAKTPYLQLKTSCRYEVFEEKQRYALKLLNASENFCHVSNEVENESSSEKNLDNSAVCQSIDIHNDVKVQDPKSDVENMIKVNKDKDTTIAQSDVKSKQCRMKESGEQKRKIRKENLETKALCEQCGSKFARKDALNRHLQMKRCSKSIQCKLCSKSFPTNAQYRRHQENEHNVRYTCRLCKKTFVSYIGLKTHQRHHMGRNTCGNVPKTFECNLCDRKYTASSSLKNHLIVHHKHQRVKCLQCGATFCQRSHLSRHILTIHEGVKPYKCVIGGCGKAFVDSRSLNVHKRSHTGLRPFCCDNCGKCFSDKQNLKVHIKTHMNVKDFKCEICHQEFSTKMSMLRHTKRHLLRTKIDGTCKSKGEVKRMAEKRIDCNLGCDKKFTTRRSMLAHARKSCQNKGKTIFPNNKILD